MKARLLALGRDLRDSFWFQPALMVLAAAALAAVLGWADRSLALAGVGWPDWLSVHSAENVRALLATIAGSMITVAGVTFSIVIVALAQASAQFGPRLLRQFIRDRGNQTVLGTFVAIFVYCLLVLGQINSLYVDREYVPRLSALVAILLAVASIGVLVYFYHHAARSMQADQVVLRAGDALEQTVRRVFPAPPEEGEDASRPIRELAPSTDGDGAVVAAGTTGYVTELDSEALVGLADDHDLLVKMRIEPGDFVISGQSIAEVFPGSALTEELGERIAGALLFVQQRSTARDIDLAVDRVAEVAVRALSPGINDPYTAVSCIDRLGSALVLMADRREPPRLLRGTDDEPRVWLGAVTYGELLDHAFLLIGHYGRDNVLVQARILEALALVASRADEPSLRAGLERHATIVRDRAERFLEHDHEKRIIQSKYEAALAVLGGRDGGEEQDDA